MWFVVTVSFGGLVVEAISNTILITAVVMSVL